MEGAVGEILADIFPRTAVSYPVMLARVCGALILVTVIGIEREWRERSAGLRTHLLVGLAAAVFGLLAGEVANAPVYQVAQVQADPLRVVEAVTAGVAFLAAGFIIVSRGVVRGLTTGAGVWLASAIGLSVGFGFWIIAILATVVGAIVLHLLYRVEKWLGWK